jgi:hypothetical protein
MLAFYLIYTPTEWASKMTTADSRSATDTQDYPELNTIKSSETIATKLAMVRSYMQSAWNIDIDQLRTVVQRRMNEVIAGSVDLETLTN